MKVHKKRPGGPIFKKDILFEMITDYLPKLGITEASLYVNQASFWNNRAYFFPSKLNNFRFDIRL